MLETLHALFSSPGFIFCAGLLLLVAFFWYLASEMDRIKRIAGSFFIVGIASFSLLSLFENGINYGIDIQGGVELTLEAQPKEDSNGQLVDPTTEEMQLICDILNERLNATGTSEVQIIFSGNKILIQIPQQDKDPERNKEKIDAMVSMLTKMARLELLSVHPDSNNLVASDEIQGIIAKYEAACALYEKRLAEDKDVRLREPKMPMIPMSMNLTEYQVLPYPQINEDSGEPLLDKEGKPVVEYIVLHKTQTAMQRDILITGKDITVASPNAVNKGQVDVVLTSSAASRMGRLTGAMEKGRDSLAVVLNGKVKSAPVVQSSLGKEFNITGLNGRGEPQDISRALANPLSSDLKVEGRQDVSAQLGKSALEQGQIAGLVGFCGIFVFCFWYYRMAGVVAMVGLSINALILLGLMSLFGFVLTLPGIAGIVLTMGVAVDANVLIYERLREERKLGRSFLDALRNAYDKAFSAIFDSNVTSLITAVILFAMASGSIKGFAVTTSVGIITSLIGAIIVTRVLFYWAEHLGLMKDNKFGRAPFEGKSFRFMHWRKVAGLCSILVFVATTVYAFAVRQDKALGIDFVGGSTITYVVGADSQLDTHHVDPVLRKMKLSKQANSQELGAATERTIKIRCANEAEAHQIDETLRKELPEMKGVAAPSITNVSASLGATFFETAIYALLAGLVGITLYLALRFEWSFAMGALVAIGHDILIVIGVVILMGTELSIIHIGAFLTVAGYSINDTIVIYDRIREAIRNSASGESLKAIMDRAINETLPRTMLTSLSTIAVLVSLIFLGGASMRDFSVTMLLGVIIGTYSSVFIAAPVVLFFARKHDLRAELTAHDAKKDEEELGEEGEEGEKSPV